MLNNYLYNCSFLIWTTLSFLVIIVSSAHSISCVLILILHSYNRRDARFREAGEKKCTASRLKGGQHRNSCAPTISKQQS